MKIAILAPTHKTFIADLLPGVDFKELPEGYNGAPWIGVIINGLLAANNEVIAITTSVAVNGDYVVKEFTEGKFKWIVVPSRKHSFRFNGWRLGRMVDFFAFERKLLRKTIVQNEPDFIHAHWGYEFAGALVNLNIPHLITIHDNPYQVLKYFKNLYRFGRLLMSEWVLNKVQFASTVSPYLFHYAQKRCRTVKIIPNPTVITSSQPEIESIIKSRCSSLSSPILIMVINGWDTHKNGICGFLAFRLLKNQWPGASLQLYGRGTEIDGQAFLDAKSLGLTGVTFNGSIPNIQLIKQIQTAHLLLHPALEEAFGVVLIEAMALGIPAIGGFNSGGVPWVIDNPDLLVDVSNPKEIMDKIIQLLTSIELYEQLSLSSYNNVKTRFSSDRVVDSYLNYYNEIINKWE